MTETAKAQDDRPWVGEGIVTEIEDEANYSVVHIDSVKPKLKWPRKVNVFPDQPELEVAKAAKESGQLVAYKIEKNAKGYRDLTELAPKNGSSPDRQSSPAVVPEAPAGGGGEVRPESGPRLDSYAFLACAGMVDLAAEVLLEAGQQVSAKALAPLALVLLHAADEAQRSLVGRVDRGANGHTRARGAVRTALKIAPFPGEVGDEWADRLTKTTVRLLRIAADIDEGRVA